MSSIKQGGTLKCSRVGHNEKLIDAVCMKKGCQEPIPCCSQCILREHKNHQIHDFMDIIDLQGQANSSLEYFNQFTQLSQLLFEVCQQLKEFFKTIDQLRYKLQLSQNPTLTELNNFVRIVREKNIPQKKKTELVQSFNNELHYIQKKLTNLQKEANDVLKSYVEVEVKPKKKRIIISEITSLNRFSFTLTQQLKEHYNFVNLVTISNDNKYLASSSYSSDVILWGVKQNKQLTQYQHKFSFITALSFSNDNSMLGVCLQGQRQIIEIFDLTNFKNTQAKIIFQGHENTIRKITFTDDPNYLISVSDDYSLRVWDIEQRKQINQQNLESRLYEVAFSYEWQLIGCCGNDGFVYLFDCRTLNHLILKIKWKAHSDPTYSLVFIIGSTVLMTSSEKETRFWQVDDLLNQKFNHFKEMKDVGLAVKAYPIDNPEIIINCSLDGKFVNLWNYNSTEFIQRLEIPDGLCCNSFAITSDFKKIITGGKNKMVNIFEQ